MSLLLLFAGGAQVSATHSSGLGSGGGGPFGGSKRRSIDFERMHAHIDAINAYREKERRQALKRLDDAIEEAIAGVKKEAQEVQAPNPAAVIKTAGIVSKQIAGILGGGLKSKFDVGALQQSVRRFEEQIRAAQALFDKRARNLARQRQLQLSFERAAEAERQAAIERELAKLKALDEDDDEIMMMLM